MKKIIPMLVLLGMLFAACAPQAEPTRQSIFPVDDSMPDATPAPTDIPLDLTPAQRAAVSALSDITGLPADKITLVSTEAVTWSDGCLGVQREGMMCTQALVEGFKIVLQADGREYEFHTNQTGSAVVLATGKPSASVEDVIVAQLAENLGLDKADISVVSSADAEFGDACLGVAMPDVMCAQVITPGKIIVLESNGVQYEYHTSADGSRIQPATLALTWKREGGIVGFCDSLIVFLSGEVYGSQCKSQPNETIGTLTALLSASERNQFSAWIAEYGSVTLDASDPKGVADGMTNVVVLFGGGKGKPGKPVEGDIFTWAQGLFQKLYN